MADDYLLACDESITRQDAERLARSGDRAIQCLLVWNSGIPVELIWEMAAGDREVRASAVNNPTCPLPILLGQSLMSVPSYQLDRVVRAAFPDEDSRTKSRVLLGELGQRQENDGLTLAQALTDLTGIDFAAFALAR